MDIKVTVAPAGGKSTQKTVTVAGTGVSLKELMRAGGLSLRNMQATVDGRPADEQTHVAANSKVVFTENAAGS